MTLESRIAISMAIVTLEGISGQCYTHIETSQLNCMVNQLIGFCMSVILTWYGLKH